MKLPVVVHVRKQRPGESHVSTREGITPVKPDDLIMRGVSGEEYPIGRAIFEQTYTLDTTPPAAPVQEPVGTVQCMNGVTIGYLEIMQPVGTKLYTTAAQRQWVGLTNKGRKAIYDECQGLDVMKAIIQTEAKLKEKNT
jgi:hypothetical protein